jgi:hypothetical protein
MKIKEIAISRQNVDSIKFTGVMWLAIVVVIALAIHVTMRLDEDRQLPADVSQLDSLIRADQKTVDELNAVAILPPLPDSWRELNASVMLTSIELTPIENSVNVDTGTTYMGPLKNWKGSLLGKPPEVIALVKALQKDIPMFLYDYTVVGGVMKLNFAVVGT